MICCGESENVRYCLDAGLIVSRIGLGSDPLNAGKKVIKEIHIYWENPAIVVGEIEVTFDKPYPLHDFGSPMTEDQMTANPGKHLFQLISVDIPKHKDLRNLDLIVIPKTRFGLMFSGLVTLVNRQYRQKVQLCDIKKHQVSTSRLFEPFKQLLLPID